MTSATTAVRVRGARVRARVTGDPAAPPVLLLHGIGRSLEDWAPQHDRLSDAYRVVSVDLPGFGLSDRLPEPATPASLAGGVAAAVDALGETRPLHVMGNSLGGVVAMRLLADRPDRVASLTLVNSAGFGREVTAAIRVLAVPGLGRWLLRRADPGTLRRVERSLYADASLVTADRLAHAAEVARRPARAAVFLELVRAMGGWRGIAPGWRGDLLAAVAADPRPTLVVWGGRDLILPPAHLAAARAALPHARTHLFPDAGHLPQVERADAFAVLAREHLAAAASRHPDAPAP